MQSVQSSASYYDSQSHTVSQPTAYEAPVPTFSKQDDIQVRQVQKFKEINKNWTKLSQTCLQHEGDPIRYYCKDCNEPLCGECVVLHSKHDFVKADYKAAS